MKKKLCFCLLLIISICNVGYSADNEKWAKYPYVFSNLGRVKIKVAMDMFNNNPKFVITNLESDIEGDIAMFGFEGQELKQEPFKISPASLYESLSPIDDIAFFDLNHDNHSEAILISGETQIKLTVLSWNSENNAYQSMTNITFKGIDPYDVGLFLFKQQLYAIVRDVISEKGNKERVKYTVYKMEFKNITKIVEGCVWGDKQEYALDKLVVEIKGQTYFELSPGKYWTFNGKCLVENNEVKKVIIKDSGQIYDINSDNKFEYIDYFADEKNYNNQGVVVYDLLGNVLYKKHKKNAWDIYRAYGEEHDLVSYDGDFITVNMGKLVFDGCHSLFLENMNRKEGMFFINSLYHRTFKYNNLNYVLDIAVIKTSLDVYELYYKVRNN